MATVQYDDVARIVEQASYALETLEAARLEMGGLQSALYRARRGIGGNVASIPADAAQDAALSLQSDYRATWEAGDTLAALADSLRGLASRYEKMQENALRDLAAPMASERVLEAAGKGVQP